MHQNEMKPLSETSILLKCDPNVLISVALPWLSSCCSQSKAFFYFSSFFLNVTVKLDGKQHHTQVVKTHCTV